MGLMAFDSRQERCVSTSSHLETFCKGGQTMGRPSGALFRYLVISDLNGNAFVMLMNAERNQTKI